MTPAGDVRASPLRHDHFAALDVVPDDVAVEFFAGREDQERAAKEIKLEAGWQIFPCVTVSRNEYLRSLGSWDIPFLRSFNFDV